MNETIDLVAFALLPEVGLRRIRELTLRCPLAEVVAHPEEHGDVLSANVQALLRSGQARRLAEAERAKAHEMGFRIVGQGEVDYPQLLKALYDPPPVLYVRGRLEAGEGNRALAVVGSRGASPQGLALARAMARDLAAAGVTIVSGLARGIDTAAHQGALDAHGRTVAVLGSGVDRLYPRENLALADRLADRGGAVVSEFPLGTPPLPGHFPRRNRILAGWGRAVVVVEARDKSGALVTARVALEEGREVMAVPGHPSHPGSAGTNQLIRDGAALVRNAADVAGELRFVISVSEAVVSGADPVLRILRPDVPVSLEELQAESGRPVSELLARLTELEVADKVRRLPGSLFVRN